MSSRDVKMGAAKTSLSVSVSACLLSIAAAGQGTFWVVARG